MRRSFGPRHLVSLVAITVLSFSFIWTPETLPKVDICFSRHALGVSCPTCGMTRAFCAMSHGRFAQATAFNPLVWLFFPLMLAMLALPLIPRFQIAPRAHLALYFTCLALLPVLLILCWLGQWD